MTPADLDAIEARANAAYPGPWRAGTVEAEGKVWAHDPEALGGPSVGERCVFIANKYFEHTANREFIAAARQDVPALVAEVRRLLTPAVHYVDWSSQADILFACGGDATQIAWGEKGEQPVRVADDGRLYAWELEHATCVACHQTVARRRRERDEAAAADAPARMARIMERERELESLAAIRSAVRELAAAEAVYRSGQTVIGADVRRIEKATAALLALVPEAKP